jgi:hypothetical protein
MNSTERPSRTIDIAWDYKGVFHGMTCISDGDWEVKGIISVIRK